MAFDAAGVTRPTVGLSLRLINADGSTGEYLPEWTNITFTDTYNDLGTVAIEYPKTGLNVDLLVGDRVEGALFDGSLEIPATRFLASQFARDEIRETENTVTIQCPLWVVQRLDEAIVYPPEFPNVNPKATKVAFSAATPGEIMGTLIVDAQQRGAIGDVIHNFSASQTTDGFAWDHVVTIDVDAGGTLTDLLGTLTEMGVVDWACFGRELFLFNPQSGADRTSGSDIVVLEVGRDVLDAPHKLDLSSLVTSALVKGEKGTFVEVEDTAAIDAYGRLEGYTSKSGVRDSGTLTVIGQALIDRASLPRKSLTHELALFDPAGPQPWVDYTVGNRILRDMGDGSGPVEHLVKQLSCTYEQDGTVTGQITLGDKFDGIDLRLKRQIEALTNGSAGTSAPATDPQVDTIAPLTPDGLLVSSAAYRAGQGRVFAAVAAGWNTVTENEDGSAVTDLGQYEVRWRRVGDAVWERVAPTSDTDVTWSPVAADVTIEVAVRAVDTSGNASPWSAAVSHTTAADTEPPPVPTAPTVTDYLGQLKVIWDGNGVDSAGNVVSMPPDLKVVQVHASSTAGYTPGSSTLEDNLVDAGTSVLTDLSYGTTHYVVLIAVDHSGNESAGTAEVSGTPRQVVTVDLGDAAIIGAKIASGEIDTRVIADFAVSTAKIADLAVSTAKIADLAVGTAKIDDLAVNDAKIANVAAGKIDTGILTADVTVSGRIKTSDGAPRVEINDTGFYRYDTAGNVAVEISENDVRVTGSLITETTTGSRIEIGAGSTRDTSIYYDVDGEDILAFGQTYDASTGDPSAHGILVQSGGTNDGTGGLVDMCKIYGSTETGSTDRVGLSLTLPDPDGERLRFRTGEDNAIFVTANDGGSGYAGIEPFSQGGQGFYGQSFDGKYWLNLLYEGFYYNARDVAIDHHIIQIYRETQPVVDMRGGGSPGVGSDASTIYGGALQDGSTGYYIAFVLQGGDFQSHFRDGGEGAYTDVRLNRLDANSIYVDGGLVHGSARDLKSNISPLGTGMLGKIRSMPLYEYDAGDVVTRSDTTGRHTQTVDRRRHGIGPIADQALPEIRTDARDPGDGRAVDFQKAMWMLWGAVQELAEQVTPTGGAGV